MNLVFRRFPGQILAIDLRPVRPIPDWALVAQRVKAEEPFALVVWICPGRMWADHQKAFIATIQSVRQTTITGGATGPTAMVCPDFMALDWIGPVRSLAIPIYGKTARLEWRDAHGETQECEILEPPPSFGPQSERIRIHGRRPRADLI